MAVFSWRSVVLKWWFFCLLASQISFEEYFPVYMKQFGATPSEIGIASLFVVNMLLVPFFAFIADKFRANKLVFMLVIILHVPYIHLTLPSKMFV